MVSGHQRSFLLEVVEVLLDDHGKRRTFEDFACAEIRATLVLVIETAYASSPPDCAASDPSLAE